MTDHELLRRYVLEGAQDAFGGLVRRHVDLVYSAALRQVQSAQLAEDVAQSVFVDLARNARRLQPDQPLGAWLYVVTRRTAIDVIRRESRRQEREQTAMEIAAMNSTPSPWPQVEPLLDEAMESLGDADRRAVLLRFFENQPLREIGRALRNAAMRIAEGAETHVRIGEADLDKVQNWLLQQGFSVDWVARSRNMIRFSGSVSQVERAFSTEMHYFNAQGERHFAPSTDLQIPSALAPVVLAVRNLDNFRPKPQVVVHKDVQPRASFTSGSSGNHYFAPGDIVTTYDVQKLYNPGGFTGTGQSIAIAGQSAIGSIAARFQPVAVMQHGRLVETGEAVALCAHPQEAYTRQLIQATPELPAGVA